MFLLNPDDFRNADTKRVVEFVECWNRYYSGNDPEYYSALNLGRDLTKQNIARLLRWKDPRFLTHPTAVGATNPRVQRVLEKTVSINKFRNGRLNADEFERITNLIFPHGIIWQVFLFHVARPVDWPIADQNVFRSYSVLFNAPVPDSIDGYGAYVKAFRQLASILRKALRINRHDLEQVVMTNKRLDNALVTFGQFLAAYDR